MKAFEKRKGKVGKRQFEDYVWRSPRSSPKKKLIARKKAKKEKRKGKEKGRSIFHIKIMRFKMRNMNKTLRVYCYDQNDLGWPAQFTEKLNMQASDNDRQSDEETIENDVERCCGFLLKAIRQRKKGL